MKVLMTGGGTGGHIYPAIAIADKIREKSPEARILFVGTARGLEKTLVPLAGYQIEFITASGFNRKELLKNIQVLRDLRKGTREAKIIIGGFRPDFVIGTGGYVCGPVVKTAALMGARAFIHEQNASPGLANKLLEKYAEKVFLGFEEGAAGFKRRDKIVVTGNPVRRSFFTADQAESREKLGIPLDDFVILSFGGSYGAVKINEVMMDVAERFSGEDRVQLIFATGQARYGEVIGRIEERQMRIGGNIRALPYIDDMARYLSACDVVISRAGAITVSEIAACGKPAILIPSPHVTGNHQYYNAKALADRGGAILVEEKGLRAELIIDQLAQWIEDWKTAGGLGAKPEAPANGMDASEIIYQFLKPAE